MPGKTQFRSATGCCICCTKSSSSRFTASERFSQNFVDCFGPGATGRSGELCNACVLYVKRFMKLSYAKRQRGAFAKVLDSKRGTGPKHMKQITKQQRRREASRHAESDSSELSFSLNTGVDTRSKTLNARDRINDFQSNDCANQSVTWENRVASATPSISELSDQSSLGGGMSGNSGMHANHSVPPVTRFSSAAASNNNGNHPHNVEFRAPDPTQVAPGRNRYRRNITLPPVKIPDDRQEVDQLLREIIMQNSEAVHFDFREMHQAVQNRLRLRNRTVGGATSQSDSRTDQQSVSSGSFNSSISHLDNAR